VKKPHESTKSGKPTYTVSTDKHQGPKKGPSARREQRKVSSGERKKRPTTRTANVPLFFMIFFLQTESESHQAKNSRRVNAQRQSSTAAVGGQIRPISGRFRRTRTAGDRFQSVPTNSGQRKSDSRRQNSAGGDGAWQLELGRSGTRRGAAIRSKVGGVDGAAERSAWRQRAEGDRCPRGGGVHAQEMTRAEVLGAGHDPEEVLGARHDPRAEVLGAGHDLSRR
jgi:hypothetical protein